MKLLFGFIIGAAILAIVVALYSGLMITGFSDDYSQDNEKNIYLITEQATAVKIIFARFQRGLSMREIADSLIEEKIPSPSGKPGCHSTPHSNLTKYLPAKY